MDRFQKALARIPDKDRRRIKAALLRLERGEDTGLDIKKLKGTSGLFRLRIGAYRIIYRLEPTGSLTILRLERRSDATYHF